ncbi:MAG: PEGA domain-containing protein [Candidatus Kentron sp. G]|nr:MAG: PEGA domain-containing protein [Candidatus Kentron sp. G]VFM95680.1 MAG: PEGA domain-containing protein [Candidatus Kentron sp. G]VFM99005.1 MAG: PEGA domain-containing protein [Candidatus Kentron sp. G]
MSLINRKHHRHIGGISLFLLLMCFFVPITSYAGDRVALVIGNSDYRHLRDLGNPKRDAEAVASRLSKLGFSLVDARGRQGTRPVYNLTQEDFFDVIDRFAEQARGKEIALVYYAGHGMQIGMKSYLLPVDTPKKKLKMIERRAIPLEKYILAPLDNRAELTVAIFDACREIPGLEEATRASGLGTSATRGLARIQGESQTQRLIAYSAAAGQLAADGKGRHSPYTGLLLEQLDTNPRQTVEALIAQVAHNFPGRYGGQRPEFLNQGVKPNYYYLKSPVPNPPAQVAKDNRTSMEQSVSRDTREPVPVTSPGVDPIELEFWNSAKQSQDPEIYQLYLERYPKGSFAAIAELKIRQVQPKARLFPPSPTHGQLVVRSNVSGDTVYIDGKAIGPTGPGAHSLPPGEHTVRVEKAGLEPFETRIRLAAGKKQTVYAKFAWKRSRIPKNRSGNEPEALEMFKAFGDIIKSMRER